MSHANALPAVFSNLAKAAEKQQDYETSKRFQELAESKAAAQREPAGEATLEALRAELAADLETSYPGIERAGTEATDRGVLRAAAWGKKVTTVQRSLVDRYLSKGEALIEGTQLYVCEACGFIFVGDDPPPICPACKAPSGRFSLVK